MTRDDIIRMAQQAGATRDRPEVLPDFWTLTDFNLKEFAALVAAAEREACAKVCEDSVEYAGDTLAKAIRARGHG